MQQCLAAALIDGLRIGAFLEQVLDRVETVVVDGPVERRAAELVGLGGVDVGLVSEQQIDDRD